MNGQRPLGGEYKLVMQVYSSGRTTAYLIHHPHADHTYGSELVAKSAINLTDQELLDGDWCSVVERCAQALQPWT